MGFELTALGVIGTDCSGSCNSNNRTTTMVPFVILCVVCCTVFCVLFVFIQSFIIILCVAYHLVCRLSFSVACHLVCRLSFSVACHSVFCFSFNVFFMQLVLSFSVLIVIRCVVCRTVYWKVFIDKLQSHHVELLYDNMFVIRCVVQCFVYCLCHSVCCLSFYVLFII